MADEDEISIDQDLCMGSGYCVHASPDLFSLNDEGIAELLEGEPPRSAGDGPVVVRQSQIATARAAQDQCPAAAIKLHKR